MPAHAQSGPQSELTADGSVDRAQRPCSILDREGTDNKDPSLDPSRSGCGCARCVLISRPRQIERGFKLTRLELPYHVRQARRHTSLPENEWTVVIQTTLLAVSVHRAAADEPFR